jgi:hypothetical protein
MGSQTLESVRNGTPPRLDVSGDTDTARAETIRPPVDTQVSDGEQVRRAGEALSAHSGGSARAGANKRAIGASSPLFVWSATDGGLEARAALEVAQETRAFTAAMPQLVQAHDDLTSTGRDHALMGMSLNPALGPEVAAHFMRLHLHAGVACLSRDGALRNLRSMPLDEHQLQAMAKEIDGALQRTAAVMSELELSPIFFSETVSNVANTIVRIPDLAGQLDEGQLSRIKAVFAAYLSSSGTGTDRGSDRDAVSSIADASVTIERQGRGSADFVFEALARLQSYGAIAARAALDSNRPVPAAAEADVEKGLLEGMPKVTERTWVYNVDWLEGRLRLARRIFEARGDDEGRKALAATAKDAAVLDAAKEMVDKVLLAEAEPAAEPTPMVRIGIGTTVINVGNTPAAEPAPAYEPQGPIDRAQAVAALPDSTDRFRFYEKAGDQAILALVDPELADEAKHGFQKILDHSHGNMIASDVLRRMIEIEGHFPEIVEARRIFMDLVIAKMKSGGSCAESLTYLLETKGLTRDEQIRISTTSLAAHRLPLKKDTEWDYNSEESRTQRRGIAYRMLVGLLGPGSVADLSAAEIDAVKGALDLSRRWLDAVIVRRKESMSRDGIRGEEESADALRLLAEAAR